MYNSSSVITNCVKQSKTYTPGVYFNFSYTLILPLMYNINIHSKCITNYNFSITTLVYRSILILLHGVWNDSFISDELHSYCGMLDYPIASNLE